MELDSQHRYQRLCVSVVQVGFKAGIDSRIGTLYRPEKAWQRIKN